MDKHEKDQEEFPKTGHLLGGAMKARDRFHDENIAEILEFIADDMERPRTGGHFVDSARISMLRDGAKRLREREGLIAEVKRLRHGIANVLTERNKP